MTHEYELSADAREDFIFTKQQLLAPLPQGAEPPPHTDAEIAARDMTYYQGHVAQNPLAHSHDEGAAPQEHGDPATTDLLGGGTEPPHDSPDHDGGAWR
jgi:hypothetical protein